MEQIDNTSDHSDSILNKNQKSVLNMPISKWIEVPISILGALAVTLVWCWSAAAIYGLIANLIAGSDSGSISIAFIVLIFGFFIFVFCLCVLTWDMNTKRRWITIGMFLIISLGILTILFLTIWRPFPGGGGFG